VLLAALSVRDCDIVDQSLLSNCQSQSTQAHALRLTAPQLARALQDVAPWNTQHSAHQSVARGQQKRLATQELSNSNGPSPRVLFLLCHRAAGGGSAWQLAAVAPGS
jgi:hypothetical protein